MRLSFALAVLASGARHSSGGPVLGEWDHNTYADLDRWRVAHVDWDVRIDFDNHYLVGNATLLIESFNPFADSLVLDTHLLNITSVICTKNPNTTLKHSLGGTLWEMEKFPGLATQMGHPLKIENPHLCTVNHPHAPEKDGKTKRFVQISVLYYAYQGEGSSVWWVEPGASSGRKESWVYISSEPNGARTALPIQDSPLVRFPYTITVHVPKSHNVTALATAMPQRHWTEGDHVIYKFSQEISLPGYLMSVIVGPMEKRDLPSSVPGRSAVYGDPSIVDQAAKVFENIDRWVEMGEHILGAPYPFKRNYAVVMPVTFPGDGLELPYMIQLHPILLTQKDLNPSVPMHEVAHMWLGNYIGPATWRHIWLSEGFANWLQRTMERQYDGNDENVNRQIRTMWGALQAEVNQKEKTGQLEKTRLVLDVANGVSPLFTSIPYEKGFHFIDHLERTVGRKRFVEFMKGYVKKFAGETVTTDMFLAFFESEFPKESKGVDFDAWLYGVGMPPVNVSDLYPMANGEAPELAINGKILTDSVVGGFGFGRLRMLMNEMNKLSRRL